MGHTSFLKFSLASENSLEQKFFWHYVRFCLLFGGVYNNFPMCAQVTLESHITTDLQVLVFWQHMLRYINTTWFPKFILHSGVQGSSELYEDLVHRCLSSTIHGLNNRDKIITKETKQILIDYQSTHHIIPIIIHFHLSRDPLANRITFPLTLSLLLHLLHFPCFYYSTGEGDPTNV